MLSGWAASWTSRRIWNACRSGSGFGYGSWGQAPSAAEPAGRPASFTTSPSQLSARLASSDLESVPRTRLPGLQMDPRHGRGHVDSAVAEVRVPPGPRLVRKADRSGVLGQDVLGGLGQKLAGVC